MNTMVMSNPILTVDYDAKKEKISRVFRDQWYKSNKNEHNVHTPLALCEEILAKFDNHQTKTWLVMFNFEFAWVLKNKYNVPCEQICIWTTEYNKFFDELSDTYKFIHLWGDLEDMKFDVVIGNPPFNQASENSGVTGTIGNKTLYRHFVKKSFEMGDTVAMVSQKGVYNYFDKLDYQIDTVNFMTEYDYWKYDTLYFIGRSIPKESEYEIEDPIIKKMFGRNELNIKGQPASLMQNVRDGIVVETEGNVIIRLPGKEPIKYGKVTRETLIAKGPKFCFTMLNGAKSWIVTDEDLYASCVGYYPAETLEQATSMKLFVENNKAFRFFNKKMKSKGYAMGLNRLKKFDPSQIKTGFEYPVEWNLTPEEIALIESTVK